MYNEIINQIDNELKIKTLGNRSFFRLEKKENIFLIKNSKNKIYPVDQELFNIVLKRYNTLKKSERFKSAQYTDPKWKECPNRVASVYIAAIIRNLAL